MAKHIQLRGDWRKLRHKFDRLSDLGQHMADEALQELAELVRDTLHETVNSAPPPPNADTTVKRKGFNYPLRELGGFAQDNSIVIDEIRESDRTTYVVKGNPHKTHERSKKTYDDVLGIVSEGGGNVPSRNVIEIAYDRRKNEVKALAVTQARKHLQ